MNTFDTRVMLCPLCAAVMDAATSMTGKEGPEPGDVTICIRCAGLLVYDPEMWVRAITSEERLQLAQRQPKMRAELLMAQSVTRTMTMLRKMTGHEGDSRGAHDRTGTA